MLFLSKIGLVVLLASSSILAIGQKNNLKSDTVDVHGSCEMCKVRIETAGKYKKLAKVTWNQDFHKAILTYDPLQTDKEAILKRIALAGYDNESFLAPEDAYAKLPDCCKYRTKSATANPLNSTTEHTGHSSNSPEAHAPKHELQSVFDLYFMLKDALVQGNAKDAASAAAKILEVINGVKMQNLQPAEHEVWMKVMSKLALDADHIAETQDISHQRDHFMALSQGIYEMAKVVKLEVPVYYQFCPMANEGKGANWLSRENTIKNPYLGSQMISCGKTVETIKN